MKCPVCNRTIKPIEALFSMLPWWIRCKHCKSKLTLVHQDMFWLHVTIFGGIAAATWFFFHAADNRLLWPSVVAGEIVIYVLLLLTILLRDYGLKPIPPKEATTS